VALGVCEAFTLYVLSKFSERYRARTYSVLVRKALGRKLSARARPPRRPPHCLCARLLQVPWLSSTGRRWSAREHAPCCLKSKVLGWHAPARPSPLCRGSAVDHHGGVPVGLVHRVPGHHRRLLQPPAGAGRRRAPRERVHCLKSLLKARHLLGE